MKSTKPEFANADYYRDGITEKESENLYDLEPKNLEEIQGVHSKLIISEMQGVHIPRIFAENFDHKQWHIEGHKDLTALKDGPKNSWYWEAWEVIMREAYYLDAWGVRWNLEQDGDLFARAYFNYSESEDE